jgi:protein-disulfide isomerase
MDQSTTTEPGKHSKIFLPVSIIVAGVLIAGSIAYQPGDRPSLKAAALDTVNTQRATPGVDDDAVIGDVDAPVTMIVFGDYQCPFCKQQADNAEAGIRRDYVGNGKVKMVFRDFPLEGIHPSARPAAEAAQCAAAQGKFWQYHDALYAKQAELGSLDYTKLASDLGLKTAEFTSCLKDPATAAEVSKDLADGSAAGIAGTPGSFINGIYIEGAYPYSDFKKVIDGELSKVKR